jgi:hypothetical protein
MSAYSGLGSGHLPTKQSIYRSEQKPSEPKLQIIFTLLEKMESFSSLALCGYYSGLTPIIFFIHHS